MNIRTAQVIRADEGKSLTVYADTLGNLTVGIGHLVVPSDELGPGDAISEERCTALFLADLKQAEAGASRAQVLCDTLMRRDPVVLHVLTCMVFQLGYTGVRGFNKFLAALRQRDYRAAATEMLDSRWAKQTPQRARRLANEIRLLGHAYRSKVNAPKEAVR